MRSAGQKRFEDIGARMACSLACALLVMSVTSAALLLGFSDEAQARYNDVTEKYSATQELFPSGDVLTASDIPEGTYTVPAMTTSSMCIMSNPTTGELNECVLTVSGGTMVATFYMSRAYTALYFGTAEEAAAATDETGTDGSNYIFGNPPEGYELHLHSIPIPYLNQTFPMAAYNGASGGGFEGGKWFSREVLV